MVGKVWACIGLADATHQWAFATLTATSAAMASMVSVVIQNSLGPTASAAPDRPW